MKKLILISIFLSFNALLFAQSTEDSIKSTVRKNSLLYNTTQLSHANFQVTYSHQTNKNTALCISPSLVYYKNNEKEKEAYGADILHKNFIISHNDKHNNVLNIYFAPILSYHYYRYAEIKSPSMPIYNSDYTITKYSQEIKHTDYFHTVSGGILCGFNFTILKRLIVDLNIGGMYRRTIEADKNENNTNYNVWTPQYNGVAPRIGIDVGFNF